MTFPTTRSDTAPLQDGQDIADAGGSIRQTTQNVNEIIDEFNLTNPQAGQTMVYNSTTSKWENRTPAVSTPPTVTTLTDTNITNPVNGQIIQYNGTTNRWENITSNSTNPSLSGLSDTTITTPTNGQVIQWNGTRWVNADVKIKPAYQRRFDIPASNISSPYGVMRTGGVIGWEVIITLPSGDKIGDYEWLSWIRTDGRGILSRDYYNIGPSLAGAVGISASLNDPFGQSNHGRTIDNAIHDHSTGTTIRAENFTGNETDFSFYTTSRFTYSGMWGIKY